MVCRANEICQIHFNLFDGAKDKCLHNDTVSIDESTRVDDIYVHIEALCQVQQDSLKLYLLSKGKLIDLSEMKDKTMSEAGVDFSFEREPSTVPKHTLLVVGPTDTLSQKQVEYALSTYNPPPPSPNDSSWAEENIDFKNLIKSETCYVGLVNQAMTCYLNSLLQALYMTPEFRNALYNWEYIDRSEKDETTSIPFQLQKLFLNLQTSTKSAVETTALTKSFGWDSTEAWQQHDIQELCRVMFDALEQKFKNTEQADLINRLYEGKMTDYVKCLECGTEKSREDTFLDIPLPVRPFGSNVAYNSVEEALRAFVQYETLEGSNQYHCEKCNKKCDAHKGLKFTKFPYFLTLHLKRFDFDFKTFHRIKLNDKVTFPDILNLNSFIYSTEDDDTPNGCETADLPKCDANSVTDSGTNDSCQLCECSLPDSNHTTNHDQDNEDTETSNGPSTSNCIERNHENDKKSNSKTVKGPYNYELFSIMIHSGSASGGHYYAYIKDFRTQEWLCFNDQTVTQITHDDIQKTYGGGLSRSYFSGAYSSTNAYMLMYRQIDPVRNSLPMQVQDFPKHIQELLNKMKEKEEYDRRMKEKEDSDRKKTRVRIYCESTPSIGNRIKVYCHPPNENKKMSCRVSFVHNLTWAEVTKYVYKQFCLEGVASLSQCRLVTYDSYTDSILDSFEGREHETCRSILGNRISRKSLLLEIQDKDKKFEPYLRSDITTKVFVLDVPNKGLLLDPLNVETARTRTVREYAQLLSILIDIEPEEMNIIIRDRGSGTLFVKIDDTELQAAGFCNMVKVFVYTEQDIEYKPFFLEICEIAEQLENTITLCIKLPPSPSKEMLEELNISTTEEKYKDKEKAVSLLAVHPNTDSPAKANVNESSTRDSDGKCNDISKQEKPTEDASERNPSPQLGEGEEWHTPEQSNSEDSSLSDSDKTLVGDAPEDESYSLPYLSSSTSNRGCKILNQIGFENCDNIIDYSGYYFKATPYTSRKENFLKVLVDKRMAFNTLKKNLEPYVGVPPEYFKICRYFDECGESECNCSPNQSVSYEDDENLWIQIERPSRDRKFTVKLYQFELDSPETFRFLFEWTLSENMTVREAKKEILTEMKRRYNMDIPFERCRLRKKCAALPMKVFLDHQKFEDIQFYSNYEMILQELPDKDPVTSSYQVITFVRRCFPGKIKLGPLHEIVLDEKTVEEIVKKLSLISDIPEKHIDIARKSGFLYSASTIRIYNDLDWNQLTVGVDLDVEEGEVFLYRDNRETSNETQEEYNGIAFRGVSRYFPASAATRYSARKEKALRIFLDNE